MQGANDIVLIVSLILKYVHEITHAHIFPLELEPSCYQW